MTVVFSASSVNTYQACRLQWWFTYVAAIPVEPSEAQAIGITVHDFAEKILKADGIDNLDPGDHPDRRINSLVNVFRNDILPTYGEVLLVEGSFQVNVNGIPYSGVIDSIDRHVFSWYPEIVLRDLKTTKSRPGGGIKYRYNMVGYFIGAESMGFRPHVLKLDWIVKTKKPYYLPEAMPIPDQSEVDGWAAQLEIVANAVARGNYEPTGLGTYVCNYCNYRDICGPFQRLKDKTE